MFVPQYYHSMEQVRVTAKFCKTFKDDNYEVKFLETKFDACRALEGVQSNIFAKVFFGSANSKTAHKCPYKPLSYNIENMKVTSDVLPPFPSWFYPEGRLKFSLLGETFGMPRKGAKYVKFFTFKINGIAYNSDIFKNVNSV